MGQTYRIAKRNVARVVRRRPAASAVPPEGQGEGDAARREIKVFSYRKLKTATKNFSRAEFIIVEGRFGGVYKGYLKKTRQDIAVRKLNPSAVRKFDVEVRMLSVLSHPNFIDLIGTCNEKEHRCLVYKFMPLGSLKSHLIDPIKAAALDWHKRMKIAAGVAAAMNYLHNEAGVIFRDLKMSNILLDEGFNPKLSDFGDAKLVTDDDATSSQPTAMTGYTAPEYVNTGVHTIKSDVYNFGVIMMEIITGKGPWITLGNKKHKLIETWITALTSEIRDEVFAIPDERLNREFLEHSVRRAMEVTIMCVADDPERRPTMAFMVEELNRLASPSDASASTSAAVDASASASASAAVGGSASASASGSGSGAVDDNPVEKGGDDDPSSSDDDGTPEAQARRARRLEKQPIGN